MYYIVLEPGISRDFVLQQFKAHDIGAIFHYIPLHSAPAGRKYGRASGNLIVTDDLSSRLVRLPLWIGLSEEQQEKTVEILTHAIQGTPLPVSTWEQVA
jgi:dTDP-4-amino-4,6-dideoxygalactose transaminase